MNFTESTSVNDWYTKIKGLMRNSKARLIVALCTQAHFSSLNNRRHLEDNRDQTDEVSFLLKSN